MGTPETVSGTPGDVAANREAGAEPPVFDREILMEMVMGDEDFARTVVKAFLSDIPAQIAALKGHLASGNMQGVERCAHSIKGAAANVGGESLRAAAHEMEKAGKACHREDIKSRLSEMETQFSRLRDAMKMHFNTSADG
jgi:HPt (histidine-containing phosphotransfer) domain-containing protein